MADWWFRVRGSHLQSYISLWSSGYVISRQVTCPFDFAVSWCRVKTKTFYLHFGKTFNHQTWQSGCLGSTFSSKLVWGPYITSIAKTTYKKIEALNRSMRFLSLEVALYLYKSTILHCMKFCSQIWACASGCCLELLAKLQKHICKTVGPSLAACLEPLAHRRNVASLSLFYSYYTLVDFIWIGTTGSTFLYSRGLLVILIVCMIFLSPFLDVTRMLSTVSSLAQLDLGIICL